MRRTMLWVGGLALFSLACAAIQNFPVGNVQRAVELTITALSATLVSTTPVPPTSQPATPIASPLPVTEQVPTVSEIPGCSLKNSRSEIGLVAKVVDGDTIDVNIAGENYSVRYIGIDSTESGQPFWREARDLNQSLVENEVVTLVRDISDRDRFDRLLRYVILSDGTLVNEELVRMGVARAVAYPPDTACQSRLEQAEQEAREKKVGLWAEVPPTETLTPAEGGAVVLIDPDCSQFNAPGDDNKNKNEEYVCLKNPSDQAVDLTGWTVTDEYGWAYTFPSFPLEPGKNVLLHTGCGTDTAEDLFWCRTDTAIWNNGGDCVYLKDEQGEAVQEYCY